MHLTVKTTVKDEEWLINEINRVGVKGRGSYLPPMLDKDPILAANFLTRKDSEEALVNLTETFRNLNSKAQVNEALELLILVSKENFMWFAKYATKIDQLITGTTSIEIPYTLADALENSSLLLLPPIKYNSRKKLIEPVLYRVREKDPINMWRIQYIKGEYAANDFYGGYPAWYVMSSTTIYEQYCTRTNRRVKIDCINGEFVYYLAGASDKWRRIIGVPTEMDLIVASLLFKS